MAGRLFTGQLQRTRLLYYPSGIPYILEVLEKAVNERLRDALSRRVLDQVNLRNGAAYLTVPFDTPEDTVFDDLRVSAYFVGEREQRRVEPNDWKTMYLAEDLNDAMYELVQTGHYVVVFEDEQADIAVFDAVCRVHPGMYVNNTILRAFDQRASKDEFQRACYRNGDPDCDLRFIANLESVPDQFDDALLDAIIENLTCVACGVFDGDGYLVWWPRGQRG